MTRALTVLLLLGAVAAAAGGDVEPVTLRVMTYNIHHGEGTDSVFDLPRLAGIVNDARPDLVALQEVDRGTDRGGGVDQLAELARLTHMHAAFGKAIDFSNGAYGVAILSRWPFLNEANQPLPGADDRESRTALTVEIRPGGRAQSVFFVSTHLDQGRDEENRLTQAAALNQLTANRAAPIILGGDLNSRPGTAPMQILETQWTNALAGDQPSPDGRPRRRGDYVLYRPADRWRVVESTVIDDRLASDHRPVLVVLELIDHE